MDLTTLLIYLTESSLPASRPTKKSKTGSLTGDLEDNWLVVINHALKRGSALLHSCSLGHKTEVSSESLLTQSLVPSVIRPDLQTRVCLLNLLSPRSYDQVHTRESTYLPNILCELFGAYIGGKGMPSDEHSYRMRSTLSADY